MPGERGEEIVLVRSHLRIGGGAGGEHARDLAPHQLGCQLWIFHLVANRDLVALADELADVALGGMVGDAAHRNGHAFFLVAGGERNLQLTRRYDRVVEEQLVKVSHAKKQQRAGVLFLDRGMLPHQRRGKFAAHR